MTGSVSAAARRLGLWAVHDDELVPADDIRLGPSTQGLNYGTAVFEGIRAYRSADGELLVFRMREHYERLARSAATLRMSLPAPIERLGELTVELLRRNAHDSDVYIRPLLTKIALEPGTRFGVRLRGVSSTLFITTVAMGAYVPETGLRVGVSSWRRTPDVCLPSRAKIAGGYANVALAVDEAQAAGLDDTILLDVHGRVAEASTANVFMVIDGTLVTPPPSADILPGITRATVLEAARAELGMDVIERHIARSELAAASEVFLTGTGVEIAPVVQVDDRPIGSGVGPITARIRALYQRIVRGAHEGYRHWLTSVGRAEPVH